MRKYLAAAGLALVALAPTACLNAARPPARIPADQRPPATVPAPACAYPRTAVACPR